MKLEVMVDEIENGTNILDIEIPDVLRKKWKSGLEYWDYLYGNGMGMTPSTVTIFTGGPGTGKTTLMLLLANAVAKMGGISLFNTAEESLYQVRLSVERLKVTHGFYSGQDRYVTKILKHADQLRDANPGKPFFLIVDSLQCIDDGKYGDGGITNGTHRRVLKMFTDWAKRDLKNPDRDPPIVIVIGQVTKGGKMAGENKLRHMVDALIHLELIDDEKDERNGMRVMSADKNRFGGAGYEVLLAMNSEGFKMIKKQSLYDIDG